ncbi:MAG: DUF2628 domain-containing protein [Nautiliaceae bacterium]
MNRVLTLLKKSYFNLSQKDEEAFSKIIKDDGLGKCKIVFNMFAFLFGWFYLLYRRMSIEAMGVLVASLMVGYILAYAKFHPLIVLGVIFLMSSLLSGFCYYFLYLNKFDRDRDYCKGDIECLKSRAKPKLWPVVLAILIILFLIWPWIFALVSGAKLK